MTRDEIIELSNSYKTAEERNKLKEFFSDKNRLTTDKRTILFSTPSETGTSHFRLMEPLLSIFRETDDFNIIYTESLDPSLFEISDLAIFHRAGDRHDHFHGVTKHYIREKIKPVIAHDVDDNEFNLPSSHSMKQMWIASGKDKMSLLSLKESDHVTTTTNKLKSTFASFNKNVKIFRNMFNWKLPQWNLDDSEKKEKFGDKFVIGWAGLTSHFNDIIKMKPILKEIHDKYPNVHFVLAGMAVADKAYQIEIDPKTGQKIMKEEDIKDEKLKYKNRVKELFSDFDQDRLTIEDAVGLEEYGKFYSWFDLGIAFIEHNGFNACKSEIKVVEYCKYGAIPVFSNFGGYRDFLDIFKEKCIDDVRIGEIKPCSYESINSLGISNIMACNTEEKSEWVKKISYLIEMYQNDKVMYKNIGKLLKKYVEDVYDIDKHIGERISFYNELIEDNREKEIARINKNWE